MPNKQEVMDSVNLNKNYSGTETKNLIHSVKTASDDFNIQRMPKYIKAGDVFIAQGGAKRRPHVVISVRKKDGIAIATPLTTTNDELALTPFTSRFLGKGWFTSQLVTVKLHYVSENFGGVLENRAVIRQFKKDLKQFYKGLL